MDSWSLVDKNKSKLSFGFEAFGYVQPYLLG